MPLPSPVEHSAPASAYLPRDVVNAPAVKSAIERRSSERGDDAEMAAWLRNHFFRWAIGSFEHVTPVRSAADYQAAAGHAEPMPEWLAKRLHRPVLATGSEAPQRQPLHHLDPEHPLLVARERELVEFLRSRQGTRLARKLQRINCFAAMAMWEREHQRMQTRRRKGWVPSSGLALRELLRTPNGRIFEFDGGHPALREELAYESYHMQHCLGQFASQQKLSGGYGEQYAQAARDGRLRLFTLRSAGNQPHVTISLAVHADGLRIDQIKGKQNRHPVRRYADDVLQFLRMLQPRGERHPDCEGMGLVFEPDAAAGAEAAPRGSWKFVTEVADLGFLLSVMSGNFHLIEHFEHPPASLQWLLLRTAAHELGRLRRIDPAVAAAARLTLGDEMLPPVLRSAAPAPTAAFAIEGIPIDPLLCAAGPC